MVGRGEGGQLQRGDCVVAAAYSPIDGWGEGAELMAVEGILNINKVDVETLGRFTGNRLRQHVDASHKCSNGALLEPTPPGF